jgi:hypothetical protein
MSLKQPSWKAELHSTTAPKKKSRRGKGKKKKNANLTVSEPVKNSSVSTAVHQPRNPETDSSIIDPDLRCHGCPTPTEMLYPDKNNFMLCYKCHMYLYRANFYEDHPKSWVDDLNVEASSNDDIHPEEDTENLTDSYE